MRALYLKSFVLGFLSFLFLFTQAENEVPKPLQAVLSYSTFYSPVDGPYIETYLSIAGYSVSYVKKEDGKYLGSVQVIIIFRDKEKIVNFDKYVVSPETDDTSNIINNFTDQQRYALAEGNYEIEIQISDLNSKAKPYIYKENLELSYPKNNINISGIELVDSYKASSGSNKWTKNNLDMLPYVFNFYPQSVNKLIYYSEIYNTATVLGNEEKYLLSQYIESEEIGKPLSEYVKHKKETASPVNIAFGEFDITELPSGNYYLVVEAKNKENKVIATNRIFFQRSNPGKESLSKKIMQQQVEYTFANKISNIDTLRDYIRSLDPISTEEERVYTKRAINSAPKSELQSYFYTFWEKRDELNPEKAWLTYLREVFKVNEAYSTQISKGYETDRGRVYLKYGPPNAISESYNEPGTYPYEIWHYYVVKAQRNKKFVFYTNDISTNEFVQVHSDVTGEHPNYRWQQIIYQRVERGFNIDESVKEDEWGGNSKKYFDIPR